MAKVTIDRKYQKSRDFLGAYNAYKPDFYRVSVDGKPSAIAFPDDMAKAYYVQCFKNSSAELPIEINAYTVINNRAYFVVASWDQAVVSLKRFFMAANALYAEYYNTQYGGVGGYVFKEKIRIKKISDYNDVLSSIVSVHSQPAATGLSMGFDDYRFTSYIESPDKGISSLHSLYKIFGKNQVKSDYVRLHEAGPSQLPQDFFNIPERDKFDYNLEKVLLNYKCLDKKAIPPELLYRVIIDLNELGGYSFDYMLDGLSIKQRDKYTILLYVAVGLAMDKKKTYDQIIQLLDVAVADDCLIKDMVLTINEQKGYSYDYIMNMLGLAYPNADFLVSLVAAVEKNMHIPPLSLLKKLGIYDTALISYVQDICYNQ
ncbi:MAG: hypothetical protein WC292_07905 [Clostridia bacterium]